MISKCFPGCGEGRGGSQGTGLLRAATWHFEGRLGVPFKKLWLCQSFNFLLCTCPNKLWKKKCFEFVSCHLWQSKVCVRRFFVIIKCMLPLMAWLSLEGMLPGVSVGAVSQEVPLVRPPCKGRVSMKLRASPVLLPDSAFSAWSPWPPLVASVLLIAWVKPGKGLSAANWYDRKPRLQLTPSICHCFVSEAPQVVKPIGRDPCLFGCQDHTEILCCGKQMITGEFSDGMLFERA